MKTKFLLILPVVICSFFVAQFAHAAFGLTPTGYSNDYLKPGTQTETTVLIGRATQDTNKSLNVKMTVENAELAPWISSDMGNEFVMNSGEVSQAVKLTLKVPQSAKLGKYSTKIHFVAEAEKQTTRGFGVNAELAADFIVNIAVTDKDVTDFSFKRISLPKIEQGQDVQVVMDLVNAGNVSAKPTKVSLEMGLMQGTYDTKLETMSLESVPAFSEKEIVAKFKNNLEIGSYYTKVSIYNGDKVVAEQKGLVEILAKDSIYKGVGQDIALSRDTITLGESVTVNGTFKNTGDKSVSVKMVVKVYQNDSLVLTKMTDEQEVLPTKIHDFRVSLDPKKWGDYKVMAYFEYNNKVTQDVSMSLTVKLSSYHYALLAGAVILLILIVLVVATMVKKRK